MTATLTDLLQASIAEVRARKAMQAKAEAESQDEETREIPKAVNYIETCPMCGDFGCCFCEPY